MNTPGSSVNRVECKFKWSIHFWWIYTILINYDGQMRNVVLLSKLNKI